MHIFILSIERAHSGMSVFEGACMMDLLYDS